MGVRQSPINIDMNAMGKPAGPGVGLKPSTAVPKFHYVPRVGGMKLDNTGHSLQVDEMGRSPADASPHTWQVSAQFGNITLNNATYNVKQFHFHSPR